MGRPGPQEPRYLAMPGASDDWIDCLHINAATATTVTLAFDDDFVSADQHRKHLHPTLTHTHTQRFTQNTQFY